MAILSIAFPSKTLGGDSEGLPIAYTCLTKGGKYIFVMLEPKVMRKNAYQYWVRPYPNSLEGMQRQGLLHKIYPSSGLYRNDGSKAPLWTVDWYSYDAWPCSDGQHLVRWGGWPRSGDKGQTLALAFFRSGKEFKSYRVADLVEDTSDLPHSVSHYQWMKETSFDPIGFRVKVQLFKNLNWTDSGKTIMFDIRTGTFKTIKD